MQKVAAEFIPVAQDIESLHDGKGEDSTLYHKFADDAHYKGGGQGIYAATPSGLLLGSAQANPDPKVVIEMMQKALARWAALSRAQRLLPQAPDRGLAERRQAEREKGYPTDGLVLHAFYRDLPRANIHPLFRNSWNQDFAWFRKAEARAFLPADPKPGDRHEIPREPVERLARFHLLDHVRAHTYEAFPKKAVKKARLTAEVVRIDGALVSLRFEGESRTEAEGWNLSDEVLRPEFQLVGKKIPSQKMRGYEPRILGRAQYDVKRQKFTSFELVAVGNRWGAGSCNMRVGGPHQVDVDPAPMGAVLRLAGNTPAERLRPQFVSHYGWR